MRKGIKILAKVIASCVLLMIFLPFFLALVLQIPRVQSLVADGAMRMASEKLGVKVGVKSIHIGFFNRVKVEGFYVEDYECDTLLYADYAEVSVARLGLLGGGLVFGDALARDAKFYLKETPRGEMNVKEVVDRMRPAERKEKKKPFSLRFDNLEAEGLEFWLKRDAPRRHPYGIDWADFRLLDVWGHLSDFGIEGSTVSMHIDRLAGGEKSGFHFDNLAGGLLVERARIAMTGVEILTSESEIHIPTLDISGNDWSDYKDFIQRVTLEVQVEDSSITTDDIAHFAPTLRDWHLAASDIDLDVSGTVDDMKCRIRSLRSSGGTTLRGDLQMRGLPEVEHTRFDVKVRSLSTRAADGSKIAGAILRKGLPSSFVEMLSRAGDMELSGRFAGRLTDFSAALVAATDLGTVEAEADLKRRQGSTDIEASASTQGFAVGRLLAVKDLGRVSLAASTSGRLTKQGPELEVEALVPQLNFREVAYDSLQLKGRLWGSHYTAALDAATEPLVMQLKAEADLSGEEPLYRADVALERADLKAMHINQRDSLSLLSMHLSGRVEASSMDNLTGEITIRNARYQYPDSLLKVERMDIRAEELGGRHLLHMQSPFAEAEFLSTSGYWEAFDNLTLSLARYLPDLYTPEREALARERAFASDDFTRVELRLNHMTPIARAVFRGVEVADHTQLNLEQYPASGELQLQLHSDFIEHEKLLALNLDVEARGDDDSLRLAVAAGNLLAGKLRMEQLSLQGGACHNRFRLHAAFADTLRLAADLKARGRVERMVEGSRRLILQINDSKLAMGENSWQIDAPLLELDTARILVDSFLIHNPHERLLLNGVASRSREDSIRLTLRNFDLSPLSSLISKLGYSVSGISNGYATMKSALQASEIAADIRIDSLKINDRIRVAPIELLSRWDFEQNRAGLFIVNREVRDTVIRGFYIPSKKRYLARLQLDTLPVSLLDPVLKGIISDTRGQARVDLTLRGEGRRATLSGELRARDLATTIDYTRVTYRVPEVRIDVAGNQFKVREATVFDNEGNRGKLDFNLDLTHLSNIAYSLLVTPRQMLVLNTTEKDNDLFYGHIYASGRASIQGDKRGVKMNVNATTDNNSVFYMPLTGSSNVAKADFVTFLSRDELDTADYLVRRRLMFERRSRQKSKGGGNMDINLALNVKPNVDFQLVIDPQAGDLMRGKGEGLLNIHINPRDNIFEMLGDYVIQEGSYLFTLQNVINKKFLIEDGSSIQWTGEPMEAMLDINAIYKLKTSLQPLLGATTSDNRNANTRTVPVECVIHLGDRLSNPSKEFSIRVPQADSETQTAVANILNTEATVARQFIYLLAFNSFYPESATGSNDNIGAVASAATGFELLANQVGNLLSGDDYNIILRYRPETELTGDEVDFGFSSNLINNRLLVEVEGNYIIDNKQATNSRMSNFMGEAYITWMIDQAGNLKLRGFTQTIDRFDETQGLQETGVGIYYKEDFDNLRDWREQLRNRYSSEQRREKRALNKAERRERRAAREEQKAERKAKKQLSEKGESNMAEK